MSNYSQNKEKIKNFIEKKLAGKLTKDQQELKILSEGDLQSCVYFHLRKFFDTKQIVNWHIINKLPMGKITENKKIPDIAIVYAREKGQRVYPSFLIELKEDFRNFKRRRIDRDLKKLTALTKKYWNSIEQTYFIYSVIDKNNHPNEINKIIDDMNPLYEEGYLVPITINFIGGRTLYREVENFVKQVQKLRKFRSE